MKKPSVLRGALLGIASSIVVTIIGYLGNTLAGLSSVPFDIFDWLARVLPGPIVNFGIDLMVTIIRTLNLGPTATAAKLGEATIGVAEFIALGAVFGIILALLQRRNLTRPPVYGLIGGLILFVTVGWIKSYLGFGPAGTVVDLLWLAALLVGWGWSLDSLLALQNAPPEQAAQPGTNVSRRRFIYWIGNTALAIFLAAVGVAGYLMRPGAGTQTAQRPTPGGPLKLGKTNGPAASPKNEVLDARVPPEPGTRPEYTPTDKFYRIDINITPPSVDPNSWRLAVDGLVNRPLSMSLDDIRSMPSTSQVVTLSCISNSIGGDLISTSRWTGVPLRLVLFEAGLQPGAKFLNLRSVDGFFESLTVDLAMDERILLVYDMDGAPLLAEHGFPLRIYIPDRYGMKQPKWLEDITVSAEDGSGYWVVRGWSQAALVNTTSVTDDASRVGQTPGTISAGGIAYAGARGISKVELQIDEGPWVEAKLRVPPLSPLTWVQWRYDFPYNPGPHTFRVRAYDGKGVLQVTESRDSFPAGATGINTRVFSV
jgi:DMSO/TMAO reductase YedYZ molybdopterin-dependent catalytic subunit